MKRFSINILLMAMALLAAVSSCRQDNDEVGLVNGAGIGELDAVTYTQKWDVMWKAYNQCYVGWDIESVDWDEQNAKYRPLFMQLDARLDSVNNSDKPSNDSLNAISGEALKLYTEAFDTLHDGHTMVVYLDYALSGKQRGFCPNYNRRKQFDDYNDTVSRWEKQYYMTTTKDITKYKYISPGYLLEHFLLEKYIPAMLQVCEGEDVDDNTRQLISRLCTDLNNATGEIDPDVPEDYDWFMMYFKQMMQNQDYQALAESFGFAISQNFAQTATGIEMFVTKDGIAGYRLKGFDLPTNMGGTYSNDINGDAAKYIHDELFAWRDTVYAMHENGQLKGVILDVRHNGGGYLMNLGYFSGLLFGGDSYVFGTEKQKNGIGRLDYTAPRERFFNCPAENEEDITEPIVILTDANTVSCAEVSTAAVKQHSNGVSIGTRTYGAGCALYNDFRLNPTAGYSGTIGVMGETPVYAYIPNCLITFGKLGVIEGRGISPDIEVRFDKDLYKQTGRDNQFERALEYIRNGK